MSGTPGHPKPHLKQYAFKKGNNANPLGGGAHNKELRMVKKLTAAELEEILSSVLKGDVANLKRVQSDPTSSVLHVWAASVAIKAINGGTTLPFDALLNRMIGPVKQSVEVTAAVTTATEDPEITKAKAKELAAKLKLLDE